MGISIWTFKKLQGILELTGCSSKNLHIQGSCHLRTSKIYTNNIHTKYIQQTYRETYR